MRKARCFLFGAILFGNAASALAPGFENVDQSEFTDGLRNAGRAYAKKDFDKAFKLFQRGACAGDKESQSALGRMYLLGQGVQRDDLWGYAWLKVAAEVSMPGLRGLVDQLSNAMRPEQKTVADARVGALMERYGMRPTTMSCAPYVPKGSHIPQGERCTPQNSNGDRVEIRMCDNPVAPP